MSGTYELTDDGSILYNDLQSYLEKCEMFRTKPDHASVVMEKVLSMIEEYGKFPLSKGIDHQDKLRLLNDGLVVKVS